MIIYIMLMSPVSMDGGKLITGCLTRGNEEWE